LKRSTHNSFSTEKESNKICNKPPINTAVERRASFDVSKRSEIEIAIIIEVWRIAGRIAESTNLLLAFRVPIRTALSAINSKYGNSTLEVLTKRSNSSILFNPLAKLFITNGINNSATITIDKKSKKNISRIFLAKSYFNLAFSDVSNVLNIGIYAELKVSSDIDCLNESGILNATRKISAKTPVPRNAARKMSLIKATRVFRNEKIE